MMSFSVVFAGSLKSNGSCARRPSLEWIRHGCPLLNDVLKIDSFVLYCELCVVRQECLMIAKGGKCDVVVVVVVGMKTVAQAGSSS